MNGKNAIGRRTFLRGAVGGTSVAVAVPTLQAMLNANGSAYADGAAIPKRFVTWFFGNGVKQDRWMPSTTGKAWTASPSLQPFADDGVLDYVSVASNLWVPYPVRVAHHSPYAALWTGVQPINGGQYIELFGGPKFDDVIENAWRGKTQFSSLAVQVSRSPGNTGGSLGFNPASATFNPQAMFDQMFASFKPTGPGGEAAFAGIVAARKSMLDAVASDTADLRARLGAVDKTRLDDHLQRIRELETNLSRLQPTTCAQPPRPGVRPADQPGNHEPLVEVNKAMADLMTIALVCDLTRVVRFTFAGMQTDTIYWQVGLNTGHHGFGHNEGSPQPMIQKVVVFVMQQLSYFVKQLKSVSVGAGNLLDQSCIYVTSEQADPQSHSPFNIPTLLIGRAGGALKGGVHYNAGGKQVPQALHPRVLMTMMKAVGVPQASFGAGPGRVTDSIAELEA